MGDLESAMNQPKKTATRGGTDTDYTDTLDDIILDLAQEGSMIARGKTINADMFPEARARFAALLEDGKLEARIDELGRFQESEDGTITLHELEHDPVTKENCVYGQTISLNDRIAELKSRRKK